MEKINDIAVLIPAYNPDKKMTSLVDEMCQHFQHIVIVNDGCTEEFLPLFEEVKDKATIVTHEVNKGKGRALKTGFSYVLENLKEVKAVVTVDADGQHTVSDTKNCCQMFYEKGKPVFGCRDFLSDTDIPPRSRFGNRLTSGLLKFFCDIELSDTQTGLRVLPTSCLQDMMNVEGERYEYEMNMIFALNDLGLYFVECPISVIYIDDNESSHFNPIKDSIKIYRVFFKYCFSAKGLLKFGKFCLSSIGSCLLDLVIFTIAVANLKNIISEGRFINPITVGTAIARVCSGIFNFSINRLIFSDKKQAAKVSSSGPKYLAVWFVQMLLSAGFVKGINSLLPNVHSTLIKAIVDTILFFISFTIQQKWVFKKDKSDKSEK